MFPAAAGHVAPPYRMLPYVEKGGTPMSRISWLLFGGADDVRTYYVIVAVILLILLVWALRRSILYILKGKQNGQLTRKRTVGILIRLSIAVLVAIPFEYGVYDMARHWSGDLEAILCIIFLTLFLVIGLPLIVYGLIKDRW
jgi:hypothetical protein